MKMNNGKSLRYNEALGSFGKLLRRSLFTVLLFYCSVYSPSLAQTTKVDSLQSLLKSPSCVEGVPDLSAEAIAREVGRGGCIHDTTRINTLNDLAWELQYRNLDTAILLSSQALALSEDIFYALSEDAGISDNSSLGKRSALMGKAHSLWNLGAFYKVQSDFSAGLVYYHKALKIYEDLEYVKGISGIIGYIGLGYKQQADYPKALEYFFRALSILEKSDRKTDMRYWFQNIGTVYFDQGNYSQSLEFYSKALRLAKQLGNKRSIASGLGSFGNVYSKLGMYPKALDSYFKALRINEELDRKSSVAMNLGNIGNVYHEHKDYAKALEYYQRALKMDEELGKKRGVARHLGNIGIVYNNQGDHSKALEYYFKALNIDEELGNKDGIARHFGNIGNSYCDKGDSAFSASKKLRELDAVDNSHDTVVLTTSNKFFTVALEYFLKALKLDEKIGSKSGITTWLGGIGSLYTKVGRFKEAENYLLRSLAIADTIESLEDVRIGNQNLSKLYDTTGRYQLALKHHIKYTTAKDSLFNQEKSKDIGKLEAKHEFETAETERKRLEIEELGLENERKSRRDNLQYSSIAIVLVLLVISMVIVIPSGRSRRGISQLIPLNLIEGVIFLTFLLFFEFTLVLLDPYIESYSGGEPAYKLMFNAVLAGLIFPLHSFFESKLKKRLAR
ncbi:MAG: hypothetical protein COB85_02845 [Bacteroidetes bacterium]|nr:MAG: hypothetical protein COB85_02845 [Bacteroidota bacterium]